MDVLQKKVSPRGISKKWLTRTVSVAVVGALILPAVVESNSAFAVAKVAGKTTGKSVAKAAGKSVAKAAATRKSPVKRVAVKKTATVKKTPVKSASIKKTPVKKAATV